MPHDQHHLHTLHSSAKVVLSRSLCKAFGMSPEFAQCVPTWGAVWLGLRHWATTSIRHVHEPLYLVSLCWEGNRGQNLPLKYGLMYRHPA